MSLPPPKHTIGVVAKSAAAFSAFRGSRARPALFIAGSLGAMMIAIATVALLFANIRDSDQITIEQKIVRSANKDALAKLGDALRNNTFWDTAYDQITATLSAEWAEQNLGPYANATTGVSALFVFGDKDNVIYRYVEPGQKIEAAAYEHDPALITLVNDARAGHGAPPITATGFVSVGGKVYLGAASLIVPNDDRANGTLERHNVEIYLTEFDSSKISKVQTDFLLSGVSLVRQLPQKRLAQIPLEDAAGTTVAYLKWIPATPGKDLIYAVAPYMAVLIAAIGLFQLIGLTNWNSTVRELNDTAAEAGRLREENWSKTMFLANMSHELRTPLNAVIGFSEIMSMQGTQTIPDPWHSYAGDICASGKHLLQIVNDVLELTKLQNSETGLDLSALNVAEALEPAKTKLQAFARERSIALDFQISPAGLLIKSNTKALRQIVLNLGNNAIKYSKPEGQVRIAAVYDFASQRIEISVTDQGCGIPEEKLPFLGRPFYQADSAYARNQGTGLGLAMVRTMTDRLGGEFVIESQPDVGTSVRVGFPAAHISGSLAEARQFTQAA